MKRTNIIGFTPLTHRKLSRLIAAVERLSPPHYILGEIDRQPTIDGVPVVDLLEYAVEQLVRGVGPITNPSAAHVMVRSCDLESLRLALRTYKIHTRPRWEPDSSSGTEGT